MCDDPKQAQEIAQALLSLRDSPIRFNRVALGRPPYWARQAEIARALATSKNVIVATGNAIGKSYLAAGLVLWWLFTRPRSLVVATAPSQTLLGTVLFKEIRNALQASQVRGLGLRASVTDSPRSSPQVVEVFPGWGVLGISTRGVERLSGQHNPNLLVVVDEASGVEPEIWEALVSLNPTKLVAFGNPLQINTVFHKLYLRGLAESSDPSIPEASRTVAIRVASTESPDIHLPRSSRGLADQGFIEEAERQWGRDTPLWRSHVDGIFPESTTLALLEASWLDRALALGRIARPRSADIGSVVLGVDIAAGVGADRTALLVRDRLGILELIASPRLSIPAAAVRIDELVRRHQIPQHRIVYDASGIGRDLSRELELYRINQAYAYHGASSGGPGFANLRASVAWKLRNRLDPSRRVIVPPPPEATQAEEHYAYYEHFSIPWAPRKSPTPVESQAQEPFTIPPIAHWESLREELLELRHTSKCLKIGLEEKTEMAKRLGRSPDLADALLMTFALDYES